MPFSDGIITASGTTMRKLATVIAAAALIGTPALAADLNRPVYKAPTPAPVPVYNWTGWYVGGNAGWVGSTGNTVTNTGTDTDGGGLGTGIANGSFPQSVD